MNWKGNQHREPNFKTQKFCLWFKERKNSSRSNNNLQSTNYKEEHDPMTVEETVWTIMAPKVICEGRRKRIIRFSIAAEDEATCTYMIHCIKKR